MNRRLQSHVWAFQAGTLTTGALVSLFHGNWFPASVCGALAALYVALAVGELRGSKP